MLANVCEGKCVWLSREIDSLGAFGSFFSGQKFSKSRYKFDVDVVRVSFTNKSLSNETMVQKIEPFDSKRMGSVIEKNFYISALFGFLCLSTSMRKSDNIVFDLLFTNTRFSLWTPIGEIYGVVLGRE